MRIDRFNDAAAVLASSQAAQSGALTQTYGDEAKNEKIISGVDGYTPSNVSVLTLSGMYTVSGREIEETAPVTAIEETEKSNTAASSASAGPSGGAPAVGGGTGQSDDDDDETETTTKIVRAYGTTWLETTTTKNGVSTTTRRAIGTDEAALS